MHLFVINLYNLECEQNLKTSSFEVRRRMTNITWFRVKDRKQNNSFVIPVRISVANELVHNQSIINLVRMRFTNKQIELIICNPRLDELCERGSLKSQMQSSSRMKM